jgi:DNA-binding IscR family transcriptional regulator
LRGAKGGYVLVKEPWQITLYEVIAIIDGDDKPREVEGSESSTVSKGVIYEIWSQANQASQNIFKGYTIQSLCQQRDIYRQENTMYYI